MGIRRTGKTAGVEREMVTRRVRAVGILVMLGAVAGLSACSPAEKPVLALRLIDGQPTLLVAKCEVFTADRISVFTTGVTPTAKWAIIRDGGGEVATVTLLESPSGWRLEQQSLAAF
ncbi:hypothetical protein [Micromonospora zamorensis]|uniref:hypothetical protein n=1 Tax=Micromonospora zamorensis TaxID=709883 RepID=UPI003CF1AF34